MKRLWTLSILLLVVILLTACGPGQLPGNSLYLYFPTSADNTFPEYNNLLDTSPLAAFDVSDLDSGIGTTDDLRDRILEIVETDYYEFDVDVSLSTTVPNPTENRWQIVGIGSDVGSFTYLGTTYTAFGVAQAVDTGDADAQDYARVYAGSFGTAYGSTGEALNGSDSTLDRWATAIGHTVSHEAGHNYGLAHENADPVPASAEDQVSNHILATGDDLTGEIRAGVNRHFSDQSYEILGHNLGLNIKTVYNWDFTNPNDADAHALKITIYSKADTLTLAWSYTGSSSPWASPTISQTATDQSFQGASGYYVYELTFNTAASWCCANDGVVPPGQRFHIGASFQEAEPVIVYETTLLGSEGQELLLHPRTIGFDTGSADLNTGDFELLLINPNPEAGDLIIQELQFVFLPRLLAINSMVAEADFRDLHDFRDIQVIPYFPEKSKIQNQISQTTVRDQTSITLANLSHPRHVDITYDATGCEYGFNPVSDTEVGEIEYCPEGTALSLFPATSVYVVATVVDPNASYYDPEVGDVVTGALESLVFYQFTGFIPDFNNNGVDDLLDIRAGTAKDENRNGVPDKAERGPSPWDWLLDLPLWLQILILLLIIILIYIRRRRR